MADIVNPQAVSFCNEKIRKAADRYSQLYWFAKAVLTEWTAGGLAALIPNTADVVLDGSVTDGRTPITGANVNGLITNLQAFVADLEANSNLKLNVLSKIAVNDIAG